MPAHVTHGAYIGGGETSEHAIWRTMLRRKVHKRTGKYYVDVEICQRWKDSYTNFLADVGPRPSKKHSLERIDNLGNYEPGNVRWATAREQMSNMRRNCWFSNGSFVGTMAACARYLGISKELAHWRWKQWGTFEKGATWQAVPKP